MIADDDSGPPASSLFTRLSAAADVGLRAAVASAIVLELGRNTHAEAERGAVLRRAAAARAPIDVGRRLAAPHPHDVVASSRARRVYEPTDAHVERLVFTSGYVASPSAAVDVSNARVEATLWSHRGRSRGVLCLVHPFALDAPLLNTAFFALRRFFALGADVLLLPLPFHGPRGPRLALGRAFVTRGIDALLASVEHAVFDVRVLASHLRSTRCDAPFGVVGMSLGGWITALLACVEPALAYAVAVAPVVDPIDTALAWPPLAWLIRHEAARGVVSLDDFRAALAPYTPRNHAPAIAADRILFVAGAGDRLACPEPILALREAWGAGLHVYPGNHLLHLGRAAYLRRIATLVEATLLPP